MPTTIDVTPRLQRARQATADAGLTALLISPGPDLRYLTGYQAIPLERLTCLVVPALGAPRIVVPFLEKQSALDSPLSAAGVEVLTWREEEDPYALVASLLPGRGTVALSDRMWAAQAIALSTALPRHEQRAAGPILGTLRARKSADEVAALRKAGAAIDVVHGRMAEWLVVGRTEREIAADISAAMLRAGHATIDFVIVASGPNSADPHHGASDSVVQAGDLIVVDIGGTMPSGYCSDSTRTYAIGEPNAHVTAFYSVLQSAQEAACAAVAEGVTAEFVDAAARDIIAAAGFGEYFIHRTGHGIGLETHEEPYIAAGNKQQLAAGMAFSVEPGIYFPGRYGARLEDIVVCTQHGAERLNHSPRGLAVLDA